MEHGKQNTLSFRQRLKKMFSTLPYLFKLCIKIFVLFFFQCPLFHVHQQLSCFEKKERFIDDIISILNRGVLRASTN